MSKIRLHLFGLPEVERDGSVIIVFDRCRGLVGWHRFTMYRALDCMHTGEFVIDNWVCGKLNGNGAGSWTKLNI